jgi:transcriptional regulator with XRE-family HTH domain
MSDEVRIEELRAFLRERRARLRPSDVGLPTTGRRRVRGLRREEVAALAGIGVSWYTALENGDAARVSESTLRHVAEALRLTDSEVHYFLAIAGQPQRPERRAELGPLLLAALDAIAFPAYAISAAWEVPACNAAFRRVWGIGEDELPFNAVERLFLDPRARRMHGAHFTANITPVLAMLRSSAGRQPEATALRAVCDRIVAEPALRAIWDAYEISNPLTSNACTIDAPVGPFRYETITLSYSDVHGIVIQVPDAASRTHFVNGPPPHG